MEENIEIAQSLGYIRVPRGMIRKVGPGMEKDPDREVLILTTGSRGEERANLARMGLGTHQHVRMKKGDTVILSSNPILGTTRGCQSGTTCTSWAQKYLPTRELALHTTGHGYQNDIMLIPPRAGQAYYSGARQTLHALRMPIFPRCGYQETGAPAD